MNAIVNMILGFLLNICVWAKILYLYYEYFNMR